MNILLIVFSLITFTYAHENDVTHRPKSFDYKSDKAVFVDFEEAVYDISYDIDAQKSEVIASITMDVVEAGYPLFDLVEDPTSVKINGEEVAALSIQTPNNETTLRVLDKKLPIGRYTLDIKVPMTTLIEFLDGGVKNAFWVTDLDDRYYLERYIPVNLEYDLVKMTFNISFKGLKAQQHIFANGAITWIGNDRVKIEFPETFTMNSLYYHTTPVGSVELLQSTFQSKDGRQIPVSIYTAKSTFAAAELKQFQNAITSIVNELESDYGAFPHPSITVYNADLSHMGLGGMEYAGATVTSRGALSHELFHSYFARGLSPANGNAGWIDEALASWRDKGYNRSTSFSGTSIMAANPYYTRKTDTAAYSFGARFMSYLDYKFSSKGGLKPFMNKLLEKRIFLPLFTEEFIKEMEEFFGEKVEALFRTHVYGNSQEKSMIRNRPTNDMHPIHKKMGLKELRQIL